MDQEQLIKDLFHKYSEGKATKAEARQLFDLLEQLDTKPEAYGHLLEDLWSRTKNSGKTSYQEEDLFARIQEKKNSLSVYRPKPQNKFRRLLPWAAVLVLGGLAMAYWLGGNHNSPEAENWLSQSAGLGEVQEIELPDGSKVWLNAGTSISYPESFHNRTVRLEGEAFFEVLRNEESPFSVWTGKVSTQVLGTSFNVRSYRQDPKVKVTVSTGKVAVAMEEREPVYITKNQQVSMDVSSGELERATVNATALSAWKNGWLVFEGVSLEEAAWILENFYGMEVEFKHDQIKTCRFTSKFKANESLDHVLDVLGRVTGADFIIVNQTIIIDGTLCK
ncbi:hypothetical protein GCM10007049_24120 [Echinicola pacifica]|uniref:FecR family protein n=1 Tax=Echinicola pacifica TaxID=346377 RepID=A0A918Q2A1_9BACT|nr:FecR family protein [Echinicola pacifica]GGZ30527.1 hypothetical protein GCM10007049_24120 [Echinicola pacifica]